MESGNLFQLIDLFRRHNVPIVVIGGHAVVFHGYVRATEDVDLIFLRSPEAERRLLAALREINAQWISDEIDPVTQLERLVPVSETYVHAARLMMLVTDMGFIDVFDFIPGFAEQPVSDVFTSALTANSTRFVSLAWLRKMKTASGRAIDLVDLENLPEA